MAVGPGSDRVYVTGIAWDHGDTIRTFALDAVTGAALWTADYSGEPSDPPSGDVSASGGHWGGDFTVAVSPDGNTVFVSGWNVTLAYAARTGVQKWKALWRTDTAGGRTASDVGVSGDGSRVYVTGSKPDALNPDSVATVAYDAATGEHLWEATAAGPYASSILCG